jgi:hypothetical protein
MRSYADEVHAFFRNVVEADGYATLQMIPEDPGSAGKEVAQAYVRAE